MEQENKLKLNIQLFAEEDGDAKETTPKDGADAGDNNQQTPKTFDEILKDSNYQSEFDKKVAKSLETAKAKWIKDYEAQKEAEKTEAAKLAKMNAEQKLTYEKEQAEKKAQEIEAKLNAYELKDQALTIAKEKNLDVTLLDLIDFTHETADTVKTKLDNIKTNFDKAVEKAVNEKLKQGAPKSYESGKKDDEDPYVKGFKNA